MSFGRKETNEYVKETDYQYRWICYGPEYHRACGPEFFVMDPYGNTMSRINSMSDNYYLPCELYFTYGDNICLVYGGSYYGEGYYPLEFNVTQYFGIIEY